MDRKDALALVNLRRLLASGQAREIRRVHGLSLEEAGAAVQTSAATIFRWEESQRTAHGAVAVRYAHFLEALQRIAP